MINAFYVNQNLEVKFLIHLLIDTIKPYKL